MFNNSHTNDIPLAVHSPQFVLNPLMVLLDTHYYTLDDHDYTSQGSTPPSLSLFSPAPKHQTHYPEPVQNTASGARSQKRLPKSWLTRHLKSEFTRNHLNHLDKEMNRKPQLQHSNYQHHSTLPHKDSYFGQLHKTTLHLPPYIY